MRQVPEGVLLFAGHTVAEVQPFDMFPNEGQECGGHRFENSVVVSRQVKLAFSSMARAAITQSMSSSRQL